MWMVSVNLQNKTTWEGYSGDKPVDKGTLPPLSVGRNRERMNYCINCRYAIWSSYIRWKILCLRA